jgi:hypothetical protein
MRSRTTIIFRFAKSINANANMPRRRCTHSGPSSSYRWTIVSQSLPVAKRCPRFSSSARSSTKL